MIHSGHRKGEKEILSATSGLGVSISRQFLDFRAQCQCPPCSGEGLAMRPGLRTSFPELLFTVDLASPPDGNLKTTHRSQHRTAHPCTFFHRGFLTLHRCDFLAGPEEERWRAERTLRVPGPGGSRFLGSVWRGDCSGTKQGQSHQLQSLFRKRSESSDILAGQCRNIPWIVS